MTLTPLANKNDPLKNSRVMRPPFLLPELRTWKENTENYTLTTCPVSVLPKTPELSTSQLILDGVIAIIMTSRNWWWRRKPEFLGTT